MPVRRWVKSRLEGFLFAGPSGVYWDGRSMLDSLTGWSASQQGQMLDALSMATLMRRLLRRKSRDWAGRG